MWPCIPNTTYNRTHPHITLTLIKRVDAARYFYLYLYGGVYIDLDVCV